MPANSSTDTTFLYMPIIQRQQQGMVTLAMTLLVLFLSSLMVFQSSSGLLFEIKTGNNQVSQSKAMEAARGGIEHALAWLASGAVSNTALANASNWNNDGRGPSGNNQQASGSLFGSAVSAQSIGSYSVAISLWRNSSAPNTLEIRAIASGDASASIRQKVQLGTLTTTTSTPVTLNLASFAPIVVEGSLGDCGKKKSCITGNPSVSAGDSGVAIMTSASAAANQPGHLSITGQVKGNAFSGSAWDFVFPKTSKEQIRLESEAQAAAELAAQQAGTSYQRTVYYFDASNIGSIGGQNWHQNIGSPSQPAILVFDTGAGCPKMNGGVVIYGLVYYADSCGKNGWGGATLTGSLVTEDNLSDLTANTRFQGWSASTGSGSISLPPTISTGTTSSLSRKTASWRDF
ncbi:hypothetical protein PQU96_03875 [Vogesella sp. LYT5W]|uniref:PilX N-terminal n=1 Tax=Vogesella margarita TaxID=2984199 RepID=A0ABT5IL43_9NEIS|nr:hypothetical protein [Vogesella margarita]MDC7713280.1 hypothetical protein [Vogesella margarita]